MPARSPRSFISDRLIEETYQRTRRHLIGGIIALAGVVLSGILWYKLVEGWTWLDAIYMSVITLATVGFSEVNPLGARGRLFTIILILMGVVVIAYILNCFTEAVIQGHLQAGFRLRQRRKLMAALSDHYIICGFGRTGRQVSSEFSVERIPFYRRRFRRKLHSASSANGVHHLPGRCHPGSGPPPGRHRKKPDA